MRQVVDLFCAKSKGGASMLTTMSRSGCHMVGHQRTESNQIHTATAHLISLYGSYQGTTSVVPGCIRARLQSCRVVSGHDFSRAEQGAEKVGALAPAPVKPAPSRAKAQVLG